ncbi:MAG: hypothetical protein AABO41_26530 [Acidobacteriota bacterium]
MIKSRLTVFVSCLFVLFFLLSASPARTAKTQGGTTVGFVGTDNGIAFIYDENTGTRSHLKTPIESTGNAYVTGPQFVTRQNKFAFYKVNNLYISSTEGESSLLGADIKIKQNKNFITSKRYTYSAMPNDVLNNMKFSEGMGFYSALQSADENTWLFVERNMENTSYNLCLYGR